MAIKKFFGVEKDLELFFFFWLTIMALAFIIAGVLHKGKNSGFLALGGVILIVTALLLLGTGLETTQKESYKIVKTGDEWDINSFSVTHDASDLSQEAGVIMFSYLGMGVVTLVYALINSAKSKPSDDDE